MMFEVPWHIASNSCKKPRNLTSFLVAGTGIAASFTIGCVLGEYSKETIAPNEPYWAYLLFCGIALSATALPVLSRVIMDNQKIDESAGGISLSAAVYTDIFVWLSLSLALSIQISESQGVFQAFLKFFALAVYASVSILIIRPMISRLNTEHPMNEQAKVTAAIIFCLISAQVTEYLGFHLSIGAIIAGYVFYDIPSLQKSWSRSIGKFSNWFLAPIFFAYSTMQISFNNLPEINIWYWIAIFLLAGSSAKVLGSYLGARLTKIDAKKSLTIGVLMNVKGLVELVVLNVGLSSGLLSETSYVVLIVTSIASIFLANPLISLVNLQQHEGGKRSGKTQI